jgi:hypothetical protein
VAYAHFEPQTPGGGLHVIGDLLNGEGLGELVEDPIEAEAGHQPLVAASVSSVWVP